MLCVCDSRAELQLLFASEAETKATSTNGARQVMPHRYSLLVPTGLERVALAAMPLEGFATEPVQALKLPRGQGPGVAGGFSPIRVASTSPLPLSIVGHPCVSTAMAEIAVSDLGPDDLCIQGLVDLLRHSLDDAVVTWRMHSSVPSTHPISFRVAISRSGSHDFSSRALEAAMGDEISRANPCWTVDLESPLVCVCGLLAHARFVVGILIAPFIARKSDVLPMEPRSWLCVGRERPHTRPSRAHLLARLAAPTLHERLLDPCGGIGLLCLEAASFAHVHAISMDADGEACAAARANVLAATRLAALVGTVEVLHADALRMPLSTAVIDVVVADLPFGLRYAPASHAPPNLHHARRCTLRRTLPWHSPMAFARGTRPSRTHRPARSADALSSRRPLVRSALSHGRLDVGALLRELARVVRTGGRALLFGSAGNGGTAASVLNVARKHQPSA